MHIAYLPDKTILGLGKFGYIVAMFARRLQVQERLTTEIADAVIETLQPLRLLQQPRCKLPKDFDRLDKHGVGVVSGRNSE